MTERQCLRDGRAPVPKDPRTSALMSRIRGRDTGPERTMRQALTAAGLRGYRLNYGRAPGRPDIAFVGRRVAIFVHGCFWHGCPHCAPKRPRSHSAFWKDKLDRNRERDGVKEKALRKLGWKVVTVWACRLAAHPTAQVRRVQRALGA